MSRKKAEKNDLETKRVSSITRKIHWHVIRSRLAVYFGCDIVLFLAVCLTWLIGQEVAVLDSFQWPGYVRKILSRAGDGHLIYKVTDEATSKVILQSDLSAFLGVVGGVLLTLVILQLMGMFVGYGKGDRKVREILDPMNELALRADELSRISFSEDKYQILEDAIDHIKPDDASGSTLTFGDSDLAGVEAAMNNLLLRMRDTYRQQARFVNDASHELRTPIAVIQGYANMLDRWGKEDPKTLDESITAIRNESDHMNHLVEQLLFLARGDAGRTVLKPEALELNALMQEIYEESFMIDEKHPYRFRGEAADGTTIQADAALLKQAVRILIDNAAKYTKEGDEIILAAGTNSDGEAYLQVQDTGLGMSEADVQHMFERFYRSDEVRSYQGTGLGLSIAKWIVDKHRGHFEIVSRTGLGTRIRIVIPMQ